MTYEQTIRAAAAELHASADEQDALARLGAASPRPPGPELAALAATAARRRRLADALLARLTPLAVATVGMREHAAGNAA